MKQHAGDIDLSFAPEGEMHLEALSGEAIIPIVEEVPVETTETTLVRSRIQELNSSISNSYWELSELVARVNNSKLFRTWGYSTFEDWAKQECDMGRRKAFYFVKIQNYFHHTLRERLKGDVDAYEDAVEVAKAIGWNKALKLATENVISPTNCRAVLEAARTLSLDDLDVECKTVFKEMSEEDREKSVETNSMKSLKKNFSLTLSQSEVVQEAIEKAKSVMRDGASDSSAIAWICSDFLANGGTDITGTLSKIERLLGVTLIGFAENEKVVVYGGDALERIAQESGADAEEEFEEMPQAAQA